MSYYVWPLSFVFCLKTIQNLFWFLPLPLLPDLLNVDPTSVGSPNDRFCLFCHGNIDHLAVQCPGPAPCCRGFFICNDDTHCPLYLVRFWAEDPLYCFHLRGVDALLPVETKPFAATAFFFQDWWGAIAGLICCAYKIDCGWELGGTSGGCDGGTREEKFSQ